MSVLLIDAGNTRFKWRYQQGEQTLQGSSEYTELQLPELPALKQVLVASVAACSSLQQALQQHYAVPVTWLEAPLLDYPYFGHCYKHPQRLGIDRWLAMLGTRQYSQANALVVDAGTALTVDAIDSNNQHLGGYIVPGLLMAEQALFQSTEKINRHQDENKELEMRLGQDTLSCVVQGLLQQRVSFIKSLQQQYSDFSLFITGGDGMLLAQQLQSHYYRNLVLDGMGHLCAGFLSH